MPSTARPMRDGSGTRASIPTIQSAAWPTCLGCRSAFSSGCFSRRFPESQVVRVLASSGTSSQVPSRIPLDQTTRNRQMKALGAILSHRLGSQRRPFLILDAPPEKSHAGRPPAIGPRGRHARLLDGRDGAGVRPAPRRRPLALGSRQSPGGRAAMDGRGQAVLPAGLYLRALRVRRAAACASRASASNCRRRPSCPFRRLEEAPAAGGDEARCLPTMRPKSSDWPPARSSISTALRSNSA